MVSMHRRRAARLFLLVLVLELAVLCCASAHLSDHLCCDHEACAICACLRTGLHRVAPAVLFALAALLPILPCRREIASRRRDASDSLITRKVRLND